MDIKSEIKQLEIQLEILRRIEAGDAKLVQVELPAGTDPSSMTVRELMEHAVGEGAAEFREAVESGDANIHGIRRMKKGEEMPVISPKKPHLTLVGNNTKH